MEDGRRMARRRQNEDKRKTQRIHSKPQTKKNLNTSLGRVARSHYRPDDWTKRMHTFGMFEVRVKDRMRVIGLLFQYFNQPQKGYVTNAKKVLM